MEKGRSDYMEEPSSEETTTSYNREARRVARSKTGIVSKTARATNCKGMTKNSSKSQIASYDQESRVLSQEQNTEAIHNLRLERDLEDIEEELAAYRQEYGLLKGEGGEEGIAFLHQKYNPQDYETYEEEKQESRGDEESLLGPVDPDLINLDLVKEGVRLGEFRIGNLLGSGAFAKVFKANLCDDSQYAIKCIDLDHIRSSPSQAKELHNELTVLIQIMHPNITHALQVYHATSTIYVVMELGSMDLYSYFHDVNKKKQFSNDTLREIMIGILQPLEFLHSIGICHSDIKMENTLVMPIGGHSNPQQIITRRQIRLADFGLASISSSTDPNDPVLQHNFKGTNPLTAPEVFRSSRENPYDARPVDMWAVGCTLLEMTDGYPQGWEDAYKYAKKDLVRFEEEIDGCLEEYHCQYHVVNHYANDIVCRLLRMDPQQRLTATKVLEQEWFDDCFDGSSYSEDLVESDERFV